jgi:phosphatidylserine/phosphatidylglycerophosphate/cardiolipin synthase-like enzyme
MTSGDFSILSRPEYFRRLIELADQAQTGDRLAVQAMAFDPRQPLIVELMQALRTAAKRGADITLIVDAYNFIAGNTSVTPGPLWLRPNLDQKLHGIYQLRRSTLDALQTAGGQYAITNLPDRPFSVIPAGRSHIKGAVFNDHLLIGGCNLESPSQIDIMLEFVEPKAADWLYGFIQQLTQTPETKEVFGGQDQQLQIDPETKLIIDAGVPKQSAIYQTALDIIDQAERSIFMTCQYFPGGPTAQHLLQAQRRGVDVHIAFSPPTAQGKAAPLHYLNVARERLRMPAEFFAHQLDRHAPKLHAKVIATDKSLLVGSHNYVSAGVRLGTAEIALRRDDPQLAQAVRATLLSNISKYT